MRRNRKKKKAFKYPVRCVVLLSTDEEEDWKRIEQKENKQLRYINEYVKAYNLVPMKIIRKGYSGKSGKKDILHKALYFMEQGKAEAVVAVNMASISFGIADAYMRVGMIKERGFRIFTVDEGELEMNLYQPKRKKEVGVK